MLQIKKILLAMARPAALDDPALPKAIELAQHLGAELELFHCLYDPHVLRKLALSGRGAGAQIELLVHRIRDDLEKRAQLLRDRGLRVRTSVRWDYPPYEGIVRQALRHDADLVIASSRRHGKLKRWFLDLTDWQLVRLCPVPLLLVKSARPWKSPAILAAVDPLHAHAKPAVLDDVILETAGLLSRILGGSLDAVHVHAPAVSVVAGPMAEPLWVPAPAVETRKLGRRIRKLVMRLAARHDIGARRVHVVTGNPATTLPKFAQRSRARIVVMGAVSRSSFRRIFVGDTAQRVIDDLGCDVCVVKASGFRTPVPPRSGPRPITAPLP